MNKQDLATRINKIFRANTVEVKEITGQYDQFEMVKRIEDIEELKTDIIDLLDQEFKVGKIKKEEIFIGNRKIGASYHIKEAVEVAKKWGYKYVAFNGGDICNLAGSSIGINYDEI